MKKNMGTADRIIRLLIALTVAVLYFANVISGTLAIVLLVLAIIFLVTSLINFCPIYAMLNMSTRKKEQ